MQKSAPATYSTMIRDLVSGERPRERLINQGPSSLNHAELLAILLRTGVKGEGVVSMAQRLLQKFDGLHGLARAGLPELCAEHGISEAKACQLLAAMELGKRYHALQPKQRPVVQSPQDVANLLMDEMAFLDREHLKVALLNTRNEVMAVRQVSVGNVSSSQVRAAEVFRDAVRENHPSIIVAHNHPSGDPSPSPDDVVVTRDLVAAGKILDIELLDHVIIGNGGRFVSMKERGLGF